MANEKTLKVGFPGNRKVSVSLGEHTLLTDQPVSSGGNGEAMSPYSLFLASISACAGYYALTFCQQRDISTEGLEVSVVPESRDGTLGALEIQLTLPANFPERYQKAIVRSIDQCSVKRAIQAQPEFRITMA